MELIYKIDSLVVLDFFGRKLYGESRYIYLHSVI